jgi:hypothetical protein
VSFADSDSQAMLPGSVPVLFEDDQGQLLFEARKVLVNLLKGPLLDGSRTPDQWAVLVRDEALLRARLHELFLELVLDPLNKVAFTRPVDAEELEAPSLLRVRALTFLDSVLLLYLRQQLLEAEGQGVRAAVSLADMAAALSVYESHQNTDHVTFVKRVGAAIERVKDMHLLKKLTDDRFEISPVLRLIFTAETIQALGAVYRSLVEGKGASAEGNNTGAEEAQA